MSARHREATVRDGGDTSGGASTSVGRTPDIARQLRRRAESARRLAPLDDGRRDPLMDGLRLPDPGGPCSRWFSCRAQPIEVLERAWCCPCMEAIQAVEGLAR